MTPTILGYAFIGGLLPSFIWLYFLLKEDSRCPEPRTLIAFTFFVGALMVPLAIPLERWGCHAFATNAWAACTQNTVTWTTLGLVATIAWATIEETIKYVAAAVFILWRRAVDESPDYVIYLITVALGFAAAENMLFLLAPLVDGHWGAARVDGLRFLGSTLLHVVASASVGFALAFSVNRKPFGRFLWAAGGLILAVALHTLFNALIIQEGASTTVAAFFLVWTTTVVVFAAFEVLKYFRYRNPSNPTCDV